METLKTVASLLLCFVLLSCVNGREKIFTGSTPANEPIRKFLRISPADSIDFIRWKLTIGETGYNLSANYGIGKPNTSGFMNGGKSIQVSGNYKVDRDYYWLFWGDQSIGLARLNDHLLHFVNSKKVLMSGTAGWSFTLNNGRDNSHEKMSMDLVLRDYPDSMVYQGRTPCGVFSRQQTTDCYKLKWSIVLYRDQQTKQPASYRLRGTLINHRIITGRWSLKNLPGGKSIHQIEGINEQTLYFILPDENILLFTDEDGKMLVGNADFSYTLSRK